jgi:hypothetical protein
MHNLQLEPCLGVFSQSLVFWVFIQILIMMFSAHQSKDDVEITRYNEQTIHLNKEVVGY